MTAETIETIELGISEFENIPRPEGFLYPKRNKKKILHGINPGQFHGEVIGKIASSHYFTYENTPVPDLADELIPLEDVFAVGVVNHANRVVGIISRVDLLDALSKQYGRDLYKSKTARAMIMTVASFDHTMNIFAVAEQIADAQKMRRNRYFLLTARKHFFAGIFSTRDMLMYLSDISRKDLALAKRLQNCIVKDLFTVENNSLRILGATRMAKDVGGDFYAVKKITTDEWFLCVCDVMGKGMPAALLSSIIGGMTSIYNFAFGIDGCLLKINDYIYQSFQGERFITGIFVIYNEKTHEMTVYDAGHSFSFLLRDDKLLQLRIKADMPPIGIAADFKPAFAKCVLCPGDLFVIYTDGIIEQRNALGEEYGLQRLCRIMQNRERGGLLDIRDNLFADIKAFREHQPQHDDMTMIMMSCGEPEATGLPA